MLTTRGLPSPSASTTSFLSTACMTVGLSLEKPTSMPRLRPTDSKDSLMSCTCLSAGSWPTEW